MVTKVSPFAGAMLLLVACSDIPDVTLPSLAAHAKTPAALVDGAHGGNAHFFFLPPVAPRVRYAGAPDKSLSPVVEICEWSANACVLPLVSRLDARLEGEHYAANWHTNGLGLDANRAYRLRVLVAGTELGSAEIDVIRNGSGKGVNDAVPVVAGQTLPVKFRIEQGAVWVIGSAGGSISAADGQVQLEIPAGALAGDVGITIQPTDGTPPPGGFVVAGAVYDFGPHGLTFASPAQLTIGYDEANLPAERDEHELKLLHGVNGGWEAVAGSIVNTDANTVIGAVTSFSPFAPGGGVIITLSAYGTATIDGVVNAAEWAGAACRTFQANLPSGGTTPATLCVMNDATNLYLSVRYAQTTVTGDNQLYAQLDNLDDGPTAGDDALASQNPGPSFTDIFQETDPVCGAPISTLCPEPDELRGGTNDGSGQFSNVAGFSAYELAHPLNSADDAHDFSVGPGSVVGFWATLSISSLTMTTDYPSTMDHGHIVIASPPLAVTATAGQNHSCAITTSGDAYCWGANFYGALGNQSMTLSDVPVKVFGGHSFKELSAGSADGFFLSAHTCGITFVGSTYCWGLGTSGQLGNGLAASSFTPISVTGPPFGQISAGRLYTCAVVETLGDGFCWGMNAFGTLGDGTQIQRTAPVPIWGGHVWRMISAGDVHTCGVTIGLEVYCWGANNFGQLGIGTQSEPHLVPQKVGTGFLWVSAGADHTCALYIGGALYCWGANHSGQLGDGIPIPMRLSPVLVAGGYRFVDVGGKSSVPFGGAVPAYTCAVTTTHVAHCWGANTSGQLGNGGFGAAVYTPTAVAGGHLFRSVSAGVDHSCGVTTSGDTYCWGSGLFGGLGNGAESGSLTPVLVSGGLKFF